MQPSRPLAVITGASSGIGATFARELASRGYDLVLIARRRDLLNQLAKELAPASVEVVEADLTLDRDLAQVQERIAVSTDLELLINNAGFGTLGMFHAANLDGQEKMHRLHVLAPVCLTHTALTQMVARNRGAVINVASVAGFWMSPGNVSYCSTKTWMNSFTEGLALELEIIGSKVRVQALCPGFTRSGFHDAMGMDRGTVPSWMWMRAEDVVRASLRALDSGTLFVIPGWHYRFFVAAMRVLPRSVRHALSVLGGRKMRRI